MNNEEFRQAAHQLVDWMVDYQETVRGYPVKSQVNPGDILDKLPKHAPRKGECFEAIFKDFQQLIIPGVTHWQHPSFFAYFPANTSPPSILAEMLTATLGLQCMSWQTSPAATELEQRIMQWLGAMIALPETFTGVIESSASTATLCSLLTARESASKGESNRKGLSSQFTYTCYCSQETHSSIEKAVKIAGIGSQNLTKVAVDENQAMCVEALELRIKEDIAKGSRPLWLTAAFGTTGSTAIDPIDKIANICQQYGLWLHIDAAYAGSALVLPEHRHLAKGIEHADSFVFNPNKWMLVNFDCSAYFVKDPKALVKTFELLPEYLKTSEKGTVNNYRDWGISLGRRFRALKLWFVIRSYGIEGIQHILREHIAMAKALAKTIEQTPSFEMMAPAPFNALCFRFHPENVNDEEALGRLNQQLMEHLNASGKVYLTHTKLAGRFVLRLVIGQTHVTQADVDAAWQLIREYSNNLNISIFNSNY